LWTQAVSAELALRNRRSEIGVRASAIYGQRDFRRELLVGSAPTSPADMGGTGVPPTPAPDPGATPGQPPTTPDAAARAAEGPVRFGSFRAEAWYQRQLARTVAFSALAGYSLAKSFGDDDDDDDGVDAYPATRAIDAVVSVANRLGRRDTLSSSLAGQRSSSELGNLAYTLALSETLSHRFSLRSNGVAAVGVSWSQERPVDDERRSRVYPLALLSYTHLRPGHDGVLSITLSSAFAATVDPVSTGVDPRLTAAASLGWSDRRDYALFAGVDTTRSLDPGEQGALQSFSGAATVSWFIGAGFAAEAGLRSAWQTYQQAEVVPPTWSFFAALSWSAGLSSGHFFVRTPRAAR
jgi:hypothetical protein